MSQKSSDESQQTVDQMLTELRGSAGGDTVSDLMDVYESIERSYRAAAMVSEGHPSVSYSTNG